MESTGKRSGLDQEQQGFSLGQVTVSQTPSFLRCFPEGDKDPTVAWPGKSLPRQSANKRVQQHRLFLSVEGRDN